MTCKIELVSDESEIAVFRVCGYIQSEHINKIEELFARESSQIALDLTELTLIDRDAVSYLASCKLRGIELRNCPSFLADWISKEQST